METFLMTLMRLLRERRIDEACELLRNERAPDAIVSEYEAEPRVNKGTPDGE